MKFTIDKTIINGVPTTAVLEHDGEKINWNVAMIDKTSFKDDYDIFEQLNGFWEYIPKSKQDEIFAVYKEIRYLFDNVWDNDILTVKLYKSVADIYHFHELSDIRHWQDFHSNIIVPNGVFNDSFAESNENQYTKERTYLKDEYKSLVTLSIALRVMVPIWGEFISRTKKETGTVFKELYAYKLLSFSNIFRSEPMERLRLYVEHSLYVDKPKESAILGGISSEDFPSWILALVLVRRLSIGDVRGYDPKSLLIVTISHFIRQRVQGHDNSFIGAIRPKVVAGQGTDSETNISQLEGYKIKQELPAGDIAILGYYADNPNAMAVRICPNIDLNIVEKSLISTEQLINEQLWKPQIILIQLVMKQVIPPKGIMHLSKITCLRLMAVTQALLIHKKHYELAGLLSAIEQTNREELYVSGTESRARLTKEQSDQLEILYPHTRKPVGKQKLIKRTNSAIEAIDSLAIMFSERDWLLTLPQEYVGVVTGNDNNRKYYVPCNIKPKLADLAISLASRSFSATL